MNDFLQTTVISSTIIVFGLCLFLFTLVYTKGRGLSVRFLDVGQGDAIFITSVTGKQLLIDGGRYLSFDSKLSSHLAFYDRSLDFVIATHPDLDHIGGLVRVVKYFDISHYLHSGFSSHSSAYQALQTALVHTQQESLLARVGQEIWLDPYTYIQILSPHHGLDTEDPNDHSVVLILHYGDNKMLLTGDASLHKEHELVNFFGASLEADILKLGHHGSNTSTSGLFLDTVKPDVAIVSAGCDNPYGHPHPDVLSALSLRNISVRNTCDYGDIHLQGNGEHWRLL